MAASPPDFPPSPRPPAPGPDLPPIEPPTAGFIIQLFVIPAFIVGLVIGVWVLFGKLAGADKSPEEYIRVLRQDPSPDRRWRAAYDLAQLIENSPTLRHDKGVSVELAAAFQDELDREAQRQRRGGRKADVACQTKRLEQYLALTVGQFDNPSPLVGQVLCQAVQPPYQQDVRSAALWSLARLGSQVRNLTEENPDILPALEKVSQPTAGPVDPDALQDPCPDALGGDRTPEPGDTPQQRQAAIRKLAVFAMGALGDPDAIPALTARLADSNREVCYHAAIALAQVGSPAGLPVLREMLGAPAPKQVQATRPDDLKRWIVMDDALQALETLVRKDPGADLRPVRGAVERLTHSGAPAQIQIRATELLNTLKARDPRSKPPS